MHKDGRILKKNPNKHESMSVYPRKEINFTEILYFIN